MIRRVAAALAVASISTIAAATPAAGLGPPCTASFKAECFGLESLDASLSTIQGFEPTQAGAHPDLTYSFSIAQDPGGETDKKGLHEPYAPVRDVRFDAPPGLIGDPSVLGAPQQCTALELIAEDCPNGSQIGIADVDVWGPYGHVKEPVYMMQPPGGDVVARVGLIAAFIPIYADATVRSEGDYGLSVEINDSAAEAKLVNVEATLWGVPADPSHDRERCTPREVIKPGCTESSPRPPGSRPLPFLTNPTRCGVPLSIEISAASWAEPDRFDARATDFPTISGCDKLPYGPDLTIEPTNHRAAAPTGLDITARLPASVGVNVLEPAQTRDVRVKLPESLITNSSAAEGLEACSEAQVHFHKRVASECPDAAKVADFEAEIPALPRRIKGAVYLREPEPGNLFRVWLVADDLGAHVKLPAQLVVDQQTGQIESVLLEAPQAPLREVKLILKSGDRAPLVNPSQCGTYDSSYEFVPWSGGLPRVANTQMTIDEGCQGLGGFAPKLSAGTEDPSAGRHSPFVFRMVREDGEQNPAALDVTLPKGLTATIAGVPRCEGAAAESGECPADSRIGKVTASAGAGPTPLWVPQPGKRPTAVYLAGPYKGAPLSVVAVVPAQAGPFDLGNQVVRSALSLDPVTAQGTLHSDPLPQILEGVPIRYRTVQVEVDRKDFTLNPTGCTHRSIDATITSSEGAIATPSAGFTAVNCANLGFKSKLALRLFGGTHRGAHPRLRTTLNMPSEGANIGAFSVALPHAEFLDQAHIKTVCTRVQFRAQQCPAGSIYGHVKATTPILDVPLEGPIYLRSSDHPLPDMVAVLKGPPSLPVEVNAVGRIDSIHGGIRATFEGVPDAPIKEVVASFPGGKKGLMVNSTNLCAQVNRATAKFTAQNGRQSTLHPAMRNSCKKKAARSR